MDIIEVLEYVNNNPESGSNEVSAHFKITLVDAAVRLCKLRSSGLIRKADRSYPFKYLITQFGKNYLKYRQENPGKKKQWHGMIPKKFRDKGE